MISAVPAPFLVTMLDMGRQRFLHGLDCVPDDRLAWSPGGPAHAPLTIAGRLAFFLDYRARVLQSPPGAEVDRTVPPMPVTREEAKTAIEAAFNLLDAAVQGLSDEDVNRPLTMPWGSELPLGAFLLTSLNVIGYFQGQLNYCQLSYGDTDPNIPPSWRPG